ncbi:hypothetical protein FO519_003091 [Halicephalobus sp. NKZ332]|nr:hypothetical protein FO519_003091 [Halicephalobus sp. NKZ332]
MMFMVLILSLMIFAVKSESSCQKLAVCAIDKCIPPAVNFPDEQNIIPGLLSKANFACILGPICYEYCAGCESCQYAQEQMKRLILRERTGGQCPGLESCAKSCLEDQVRDPFSCVFKDRCAKYCLDNKDCPQCYDIVKRIFTGYCYRGGFIEHYGRKCRVFFDQLTDYFVNEFQ